MASEAQLRTRLCVVVTADAAGARERLAAALGAADVASVILAPTYGRSLDAVTVQPLVALAQQTGAAALIADDARLARTIKADGAHISLAAKLPADFESAREILGRGGIVGADAGRSRHDAMALGEAGADYVGFGVPVSVKEQDKARDRRLELVAWWAEIFEPPCVAFDVTTSEEAAELARVGADFIAVTLPDAAPADDVRRLIVSVTGAIASARTHAGGAA